MPRKRIFNGESPEQYSPRIHFRVTNDVKNILEQVDNKSDFIREAIKYYWRFHKYDYLDSPSTSSSKSIKSPAEKDKPVSISYTPAYRRG